MSSATPMVVTSGQGRRTDPVAAILLLLAVPTSWSAWRVSTSPAAPLELPAIRTSVNPNFAPWWELAALPGIGEGKARQIVAYREAHAHRLPVFLTLSDLEPVPGIGSKTLQRIARYLRFED